MKTATTNATNPKTAATHTIKVGDVFYTAPSRAAFYQVVKVTPKSVYVLPIQSMRLPDYHIAKDGTMFNMHQGVALPNRDDFITNGSEGILPAPTRYVVRHYDFNEYEPTIHDRETDSTAYLWKEGQKVRYVED